jgi:cobalt/nickel transport system permease protein
VHHRTVERIAASNGPIHRLDPRVKLIAALVFVISVSVFPGQPYWLYLGPLTLVCLGILIAGLPWGFVLSRSLLVLPFVGLVAIFLPFTRGETILWTLDGSFLVVYAEGLQMAITILIKGVLAILAVGWLVFTTPFRRLLQGLRALYVPKAIVVVLAFLFRYLDLLADESLRIRRARQARMTSAPVRWRWRSTGGMVGRLFIRALDRAERVHRAMIARCYQGEIYALRRLSLRSADVWFVVLFVLALTAMLVLAKARGY